jgi:hypothetical protein
MAFRVITTQTGRNNMRASPSIFNEESKVFRNAKQVKTYLKETYGNKRGKPMYVDTKKGKTLQVGKIFGFWNSDISHNSPKWFQEDWVEVRKEKYTYPKFRSKGVF